MWGSGPQREQERKRGGWWARVMTIFIKFHVGILRWMRFGFAYSTSFPFHRKPSQFPSGNFCSPNAHGLRGTIHCAPCSPKSKNGCGSQAGPAALSPWDVQEQKCLGLLPPSVAVCIWFWYQELQASLASVGCKPAPSVFPCILWAVSFSSDRFPLVQVGTISFFACMYSLCNKKRNYETKAPGDWLIALWNGEKHGFQNQKANLKSSSGHLPTVWF